MSDEFLANVPQEGDKVEDDNDFIQNTNDPFAEFSEEETDTPSDSPPEEQTEEDETESSSEEEVEEKDEDSEDTPEQDAEKNVPFHKHPRWKEVMSELKELRNLKEESQKEPEEPEQAPDWFKDAFGDDEKVWEKYRAYDAKRKDQIKKEVAQELTQKQEQAQQEAQQEAKQYEEWVEEQVTALKEKGYEFDRNKLLKTALDYSPMDEEGNIDFNKAYDIYKKDEQLAQKSKSPKKTEKKRKEAAAASTPRGGGGGEKNYQTPETLKELRRKGLTN